MTTLTPKTGLERVLGVIHQLDAAIATLDLAACEEQGELAADLFDQRDALVAAKDALIELYNAE